MKVTKINQFKAGEKIQGFYLCCEKNVRITRNGELYLDLILQDQTGKISAKIWDYTDKYVDSFQKGDPVAVKGVPTLYQNDLQLTISHINYSDSNIYEKYGFKPELLIPTIQESVLDLYNQLLRIIHKISDKELNSLTRRIVLKYKDEILTLPASINYHHFQRGGWLKHTLSCSKIGLFLADHYKNLSRDLVLSGCILHDIGKVKCISSGLEADHTPAGLLEGHSVAGWNIIQEEINNLKEFDKDMQLQLSHIILSHQGTQDKGSPLKPKFPEALLVHFIDNMDGKMNIMENILTAQKGEDEWTDNKNYFHTKLWNKR